MPTSHACKSGFLSNSAYQCYSNQNIILNLSLIPQPKFHWVSAIWNSAGFIIRTECQSKDEKDI